jgi:AraC family transcriptional activator of pobA
VEVFFHTLEWRHNIRLNRHDFLELIYLHSGQAACQIQDRVFSLKPGELVVVDSTVYHRLTAHPHKRLKVVALLFLPELIGASELNTGTAEYLKPFSHHRPDFPYVVPAGTGVPAEVFKLIKRMHAQLPASSDLARLIVRTCLKMILVLLRSHYAEFLKGEETFDRRQRAIHRFSPVFEFVEQHYPNRIRLQDAAAKVNMSRTQFKRLFKQVTGQSFVPFLNHFRIAKAQALLRTTDNPVSEVAYQTGFCNQSYFSALFRKTLHLTPFAYRQKFGHLD